MAFQSTPVITDGRTRGMQVGVNITVGFNPRPSLLTGERKLGANQPSGWNCFNPRPSLLTGELGTGEGEIRRQRVSIHARHY